MTSVKSAPDKPTPKPDYDRMYVISSNIMGEAASLRMKLPSMPMTDVTKYIDVIQGYVDRLRDVVKEGTKQ